MGNTELTKYYLSKQPIQNKMNEVPYFNIIKALDAHFQGDWTWELINETFAMDASQIGMTVILYVPGHVYSGRAVCPVKEFGLVHLFALVDASQSFTIKSGQNGQPNNNQQQPQNMTSEQIMNAINGGPVDSAAQFHNAKDQNGQQAQEIPYNQVTDNAHQQMNQEMFGNQMNPPQPPQNTQPNNDEYNKPQERLRGYSQSQLDRIDAFKKQWDIMNNEMFSNYVSMWHDGYTKKDLNPQNVEDFLAWTQGLGK